MSSPAINTARPITAEQWQAAVRLIPWSAIGLTIVSLTCMGVSAGIIIISNRQTVESWKISPAVLLAFFSSIWSGSIATLLTISITITWWRSASRGATLESLHYIWRQAFGLRSPSALRSSGTAQRVFLLAWLVIAAQVAHNPLLQRATHTGFEQIVQPDIVTLAMAQEVPGFWMGTISNASTGSIYGNRTNMTPAQQWWLNSTITIPSSTESAPLCDGTCQGKVKGIGFSYDCNSTRMEMDYLSAENKGKYIFSINTTLAANETGAPVLRLTTLFASELDTTCMATLTLRICDLQAAVVEYPVIIQNNTVSLDKNSLDPPSIVRTYVSDGDLPTAQEGQPAGPLEGLKASMGNYLATNISLVVYPTFALETGNLIGDMFFLADASDYNQSIFHVCGLKWADPTQYVLDSMQEYLFRTSIDASTDADLQNFSVQRTTQALIFQSNYRYLAAAMAVMLFSLLAVVLQLYGWWEVRRLVSLSPIEIARSFGALLVPYTETLTVNEILKAVGQTTVQYDGQVFSGSAVPRTPAVEALRTLPMKNQAEAFIPPSA